MPIISPIDDCQAKAINLKTALTSVIFDEFQNLFLLENYLQCLIESKDVVEKLIKEKMEETFEA